MSRSHLLWKPFQQTEKSYILFSNERLVTGSLDELGVSEYSGTERGLSTQVDCEVGEYLDGRLGKSQKRYLGFVKRLEARVHSAERVWMEFAIVLILA